MDGLMKKTTQNNGIQKCIGMVAGQDQGAFAFK
jgi:hypothetical protein